jgi:hypothetical protein
VVRDIIAECHSRENTAIDSARGASHMSSGDGGVDFILWMVSFVLVVAFAGAVFTQNYVGLGVYGAALLVCLVVHQYVKKANGRTRSDDG